MEGMNTCGACRFWGVLPSGASYRNNPEHGFKTCGVIEHDPNEGATQAARAYVTDASGYWAALRCKEDFGCVLWEKKP